MAAPALPDALAIVGVDHLTAPLDWREVLAERALPARLGDGVAEVVGLATCDRVEWIGVEHVPGALRRAFAIHLADLPPAAAVLDLQGDAALVHVFAVAAGMQSQVVGEPEILGQLKHAHREALAAGTAGPLLDQVFGSAYTTAKRVRSETTLGTRPVSIAAACHQIARDVFGALEPITGLLVGGADIGLFLAERLRLGGLLHWQVMARAPALARDLARSLGGAVCPLEDLAAAVERADVIVASVGRGAPVITSALLKPLQRKRRFRPLYLVDAGLPADIEPGVADLDGVFLYTLDDLERIAAAGRQGRQAALAPALAIVDEQRRAFRQDVAARSAAPVVTALRRHAEALRVEALAEAPDDAQEATRRLLARLLHRPSEVLRAADPALDAAARRLFGLEEDDR
ncbi:MAG: glutamyl-tRNA reductase [Alphaproteobacteria bacterium]|nr:glutamyl-tRNA reductase [Alphaproteobacteria bacterium]